MFKDVSHFILTNFLSLFNTFSDFEQEEGYPKQVDRFLDLSVRGLCTDERGVVHNIDKGLMTGINL
jgi:hypothetical protein